MPMIPLSYKEQRKDGRVFLTTSNQPNVDSLPAYPFSVLLEREFYEFVRKKINS